MSRKGKARMPRNSPAATGRRVSSESVYNRGATRVPIEKLPILGTTWHTRGVSYWARRALLALVLLVAWIASATITVTLTSVIVMSRASAAAKAAALVVIAATLIYSSAWAGRWFWRAAQARKRGEPAQPASGSVAHDSKRRRSTAATAGMSAIARTQSIVGGILLAFSGVFSLAWTTLYLISECKREYGTEHDARLRLQQRHTARAKAAGTSTASDVSRNEQD